MARRKRLADPVRARIVEIIDQNLETAQEHIQIANDLAALLNALDDGEEKIEIEGTVVTGLFKTKAK